MYSIWPLTQGMAWDLWPCDLCCLTRLLDSAFQETFQALLMTLHLVRLGGLQEAGCSGGETRCSLASRADQKLQALVEVQSQRWLWLLPPGSSQVQWAMVWKN